MSHESLVMSHESLVNTVTQFFLLGLFIDCVLECIAAILGKKNMLSVAL